MIRTLTDYRAFAPLWLFLAVPLFLARPAWAQRLESRWAPAVSHAAPAPRSGTALTHLSFVPADSSVIPRTYWLEGGAVLGGLSALAGAVLGVELCHYDSPCGRPVLAALGGAALMAVVGFGIGALIGGQFATS